MPIIDYKLQSEKALKILKTQINSTNLKYLEQFIDGYDVSYARQTIFFKHINFLLEKTDDIKRDMHNPEVINKIFKKFRSELSPSYYSTIVNVSLRFVKWLNDGEKPKGFKDVKNQEKNKQRDLEAEDMITWDDGLKIANETNSIQLKAIILTQLDGGFRPSELIDLKYGDVVYEKPFLIVKVRDGKTGKRDVPLYKCVPYLHQWINEHPTKNKNDPLWVMEFLTFTAKKKNERGIVGYKYPALLKRVKALAKSAGINKPVDFYNFRHSACTIAKLENMNVELASNKFGHSVKHFTETYGRLDLNGMLERHKKHIGVEIEHSKDKTHHNVVCEICGYDNPPKTELCKKCFNPLTVEKALEIKSAKDKEIEQLKAQMSRLAEAFEIIQLKQELMNKEQRFQNSYKA